MFFSIVSLSVMESLLSAPTQKFMTVYRFMFQQNKIEPTSADEDRQMAWIRQNFKSFQAHRDTGLTMKSDRSYVSLADNMFTGNGLVTVLTDMEKHRQDKLVIVAISEWEKADLLYLQERPPVQAKAPVVSPTATVDSEGRVFDPAMQKDYSTGDPNWDPGKKQDYAASAPAKAKTVDTPKTTSKTPDLGKALTQTKAPATKKQPKLYETCIVKTKERAQMERGSIDGLTKRHGSKYMWVRNIGETGATSWKFPADFFKG